MKRIKMIGLAAMAVLALAAIASATAMAAENPVLVTSTGAAVNTVVTSKSVAGTTPTLQTVGGAKIECEAETDSGKVVTTKTGEGMTNGTATVTFTGCSGAGGNCQNTSKVGEITGTVSTLLVWVGKESEKVPGTLVSILPYTGAGRGKNALLSFKCNGSLVDVEGAFIATTNRALNATFTTALLIGKQTGGVQEHKKYTENGKEGEVNLFSNLAGGAFEQSGEGIESEETFKEKVEITEN